MVVVNAEELFIFYSWCSVKTSLYGNAVTKGPIVHYLEDMNLQHWWKDNYRRKLMSSEQSLS